MGVGSAAAGLAVGPSDTDQRGRISLEDIYSPDRARRIDFSGRTPRVTWLDAQHFLLSGGDGEERTQERVDVRTGKSEPLFDPERMQRALEQVPGMDKDTAHRLAGERVNMDPAHTGTLINVADDLFFYRFGGDQVQRLTFDRAEEEGEEASPDGRSVSYVRDHDLYLVDLATARSRQLTSGGGPELFNGRLDWVYQEEVYGRGNFQGYWWSPDSMHLVYLQLDEAPVREFTVVDHIPDQLDVERTNYPLAGAPNPTVRLGVVSALGGETRWIDTSRYQTQEHLIVRVGWTPDSSRIVFQVQDREQTWLDLDLADPETGEVTRLLRETTPAFTAVNGEPVWLADGGFLWPSERTGFNHIYRYDRDGTETAQLTSGDWEVREIYGVDEKSGYVYFAGMRSSPIAPQIYRVPLAGGEPERLSRRDGSHDATFSPDFAHFTDAWSDLQTPQQLRLHRADGTELRVVEANPIPELERFDLGSVELLQVPTRDGYPMEAMLIKPPDFDPSRRYPVLQYNYGGPHAPVVRNAWGGQTYMWHQLLAQHGYVIWMCDNRSASGKGIAPTWQAYGRMGTVELRDIEDGLDWLGRQPWVDGQRIGIWGWSYGGFMASFALTHSKRFKMGIAGAPVTDWRLYDSIYTERYMKRPENNLAGYDETSVVKAAADLHGKLLILHGSIDDDVHMQNSMKLIYELEKAGKEFELMIYPKSRHGVRDPELVFHLRRLMTDFVLENL